MSFIRVGDKDFRLSLPAEDIQIRINEIAWVINQSMQGKELVFLAILNGAFMFASDLMKAITLDCKISFLKLASYQGDSSTGVVTKLIGLSENLKNKTVVVLEDIVDTGHTLDAILQHLQAFEPANIKVACLLHKPTTYLYKHTLDFIGFEIPNKFIVGYGLDYQGYGRNFKDIYTVIDSEI